MAELRRQFHRARSLALGLRDRGISTYAASCAFYVFLSLFPMAALAVSLVPCAGISEAALLRFWDTVAPTAVAALLRSIQSNVYEYVFPALPLSLLGLLWSAARAFSELLKGMTAMIAPGERTSFLRRRLRAVLLTAALLLTLLLSLALLIFGARLTLILGILYPRLRRLLGLLLILRYGTMAVLLWLLFVFLYRSVPGRAFSFREVRSGAAFAAGAWIFFSALFSLYADRFLNLTLYGSMAVLALTMLWLFYCQYILLVGAGICGLKRDKKEAASRKAAS